MVELENFRYKSNVGNLFLNIACDLYYNNLLPHIYVKKCWDKYNKTKNNSRLDIKVFKYIIISALMREDIEPIFTQAKVAFVPNVDYDIILYTEDNFPISLSLKTSMRERYKQADLEAVALKYVHRRAKSYLINLSETETRTRKQDINKGNIMGLNDFILATDTEFDDLVFNLKKQKYIIPEKIEIITSSVIIRK